MLVTYTTDIIQGAYFLTRMLIFGKMHQLYSNIINHLQTTLCYCTLHEVSIYRFIIMISHFRSSYKHFTVFFKITSTQNYNMIIQ